MNNLQGKKRYHSPYGLIKDCLYLLLRIRHVKYAFLIAQSVLSNRKTKTEPSKESQEAISSQFRERLLLAVTSVNECTACSYIHTKVALKEGVNLNEIRQILEGDLSACPEDEITALLYAQHWAETDGNVDDEAKERFVDYYGPKKAGAIEFCLGAIRIGNLLANTFQYISSNSH